MGDLEALLDNVSNHGLRVAALHEFEDAVWCCILFTKQSDVWASKAHGRTAFVAISAALDAGCRQQPSTARSSQFEDLLG